METKEAKERMLRSIEVAIKHNHITSLEVLEILLDYNISIPKKYILELILKLRQKNNLYLC